MIAILPKGFISLQGNFFREQTVKCVLSNEATVQLFQSLFSALLVCSRHWEHMFSLHYQCFIVYLSLSPVFFWLLLCHYFFLVFPHVPCIYTVNLMNYCVLKMSVTICCCLLSDLVHHPVRTSALMSKWGEYHLVIITLLTLKPFVLFCFQPMTRGAEVQS